MAYRPQVHDLRKWILGLIVEAGGSILAGEKQKLAAGLTTIQIRVDPAEIEDFRLMAGDDHFERSIIDAAVGHVEMAFRNALGDALLAMRFTGRGWIVWREKWIDDHRKTVRTAQKQGVIRVTAIRPVIDVSLDYPEDFMVFQDPQVTRLPGYGALQGVHPSLPPVIKTKIMKRWKRLTFSFLDVTLPVSAFPWGGVDVMACDCPECAITPRMNGVIPTYVCAICGRRSWCSCMSGAVEALRTREGYDTRDIERLVEEADGPREKACHLCRGVPVTGQDARGEKGLIGLMLQYHHYRHVAAIANGWDWREAENSVRERLSIPRIGEGWIGEAMLLKRVRALFPDEEIVHQGSPDWLGRQRFDIWMPGRQLAIEYNGEQHYGPISTFGGEEAYERTKIRDELKRKLCAGNGTRLIEIPHYSVPDDDALSRAISGLI